MSEFIKNHVMLCFAKELAINRGYRLFTLIKSIFRRDREPSRIPARTPNVCATREESLENNYVSVVYECLENSPKKARALIG